MLNYKAAIDPKIKEIERLTNEIIMEMFGDKDGNMKDMPDLPPELTEISEVFRDINNVYQLLQAGFRAVASIRDKTKKIVASTMQTIGTNRGLCNDGTAVTSKITYKGKITKGEFDIFEEWCHDHGRVDLLMTKEREGNKENPGLNHLVREETKQAKAESRDPVYPAGVYRYDQIGMTVSQPSKVDEFTKAAASIKGKFSETSVLDDLAKARLDLYKEK